MNKEGIIYKDCIGINTLGEKEINGMNKEGINCFQVIEGTTVYYEWYVQLLQSQLDIANKKLKEIKECIIKCSYNDWCYGEVDKELLSIIDNKFDKEIK